MSRVVAGFAVLLLTAALPRVGRAQAPVRTSGGPALLPFLGSGGFPRPRDIESGATDAGQMLAGVALDVPVAPQFWVATTVARGFQPFACPSCAPPGSLANIAILWSPGAPSAKWGLRLGPSVERTTFDGTRTGVGGTLALGARRGFGPLLTLRYHTLSGSRRPTSLAGFLAFRLGR